MAKTTITCPQCSTHIDLGGLFKDLPDTTTCPVPDVSMTKKPPDCANKAVPILWVRTFISVLEVAATNAPSFSRY